MKRLLIFVVLALAGFAAGQSQVASDNFTRANGTLGSNWTVDVGTWAISSNTATVTSASFASPARYTGASFSADQYSTVKVVAYSATAGNSPTAGVRMGAGNKNGYGIKCTARSGSNCTTLGVFRYDGGVGTAITGMSWSGLSIPGGTAITLQISGSTLTAIYGSTTLGTGTDSAYATGVSGMFAPSTFTSTNGVSYWEGGNMGLPSAANPTYSPVAGTFTSGPQTVTISSTTSGATICFTLDGSNPTADGAGTCTHGSTYSTPVTVGSAGVTATTVLKAIASKTGNVDSGVTTGSYVIQYAATPVISPAAGSYFAQQSITVSCSTPSPSIYYTTDGSTPTTGSTLYSGAFNSVSSGSETVKALCTASGYGDSGIASNAYVIAPSNVPIISDDFSWAYNSNLEFNQVQQFPLDTVQTHGKWIAVGGIVGDVFLDDIPQYAIAPVRSGVASAVTSGYAVGGGTSANLVLAAYTGKTGLSADQFAKIKRPSGTGSEAAGVCVRCSTDGTKNGYYLTVFRSGLTAELGKYVSGTKTQLASVSPGSLTGDVELRVLGSVLQPLIGGVTPSGMSATYTDTSITTGSCGLALKGGVASDFSCGNIGVSDSTSTATYTPSYPTYTDSAMSTSAWVMGWPWFQAGTPHGAQTSFNGAWGVPFAPYLVTGSTYGIGPNTVGSSVIAYRGGEFATAQWQKFKIGIDPHNVYVQDWFSDLQHQTWVPGSSGGCSAAGTLAHCFDTVGLYAGVETYGSMNSTSGCAAGKPEYAQTPFLHVTKVNTTRTDDAVLTVAGSYKTPLKTDDIFAEYYGGHVRVACKRNATVSTWQSGHAYTAKDFIIDSSGNLQMALSTGTSGGSAPAWGTNWSGTTCHGDLTTDNTVSWQYLGVPCSTSWEWVIDAAESDFASSQGIPALFSAGGNAASSVFYDWSAGTATSTSSSTVIGLTRTTFEQPSQWVTWQ